MTEHRGEGRRKSDESLRQSEERYRRLVDLSPDGVLIIQQGKVVFVNPAGVKLLGARDESEIVGRGLLDFVHPDERAHVMNRMREVLDGSRSASFLERRYIKFDGSPIDVEAAATMYPDPAGPAIQVILRDITGRKRAEIALRESEERFRQIAETIDEVFWVTSPDKNQMLYVSPAYEKIWGRPCADLYANPRNWLAAIHPDDRDRVIHAALTRQADGSYDELYRIVRPDGSERWIRDRAFPIHDDTGAITRIVGLATDSTGRKHVEDEIRSLSEHLEARVVERTTRLRETMEALKKAEARHRALLDAIPDMVIRLRRDGTYLDYSAPRAGTPVEHLIGANLKTLGFAPDVQEAMLTAIARALDGASVESLEYAVPMDGRTNHYEARIVRSGHDEVVATVRDITSDKDAERERGRLEQQLRQSQKMEAIGTLAGGIAHDFNNILTAIIGYTELLRAKSLEDLEGRDRLAEISKAGARAKELVSQILTFSRRQERARTPTALGPVVAEALKLLRAAIPASVEIESAIDLDVPTVLAEPTQIHQVVMNLASNAAASTAGRAGKLKVSCHAVDVGPTLAALHPDLRPGRYTQLTVEDNGCGMEPAVLERIFDPFFTTKRPGEGTGLGLSVVHGIVRAHDGAILVDSKPGVGTSFRLYFPAIHAEPARPRLKNPTGRGNGEHILCVDDEPAIADLLEAQLVMLGYRVTAHTTPLDALSDFLTRPLEFDAVVTDLTMPGMTGADLVERILKARPDLPVVMATGYGRVMSEERAATLGIRRLLLKPFSMTTLGEAVEEALAASREKG
ncbi:MAG TPA: PAS domain S-box protein [Candidatus Polarisedimenticolaceae bacterium]|nr:PAS domain S-box protein [Candidatus Polarisedimenticolaceae bacterium]